jgi:hypothetical protein
MAAGQDGHQAPDGGDATRDKGPLGKETKSTKSTKSKRPTDQSDVVNLSPQEHLQQLEIMMEAFRTQEVSLYATLGFTSARTMNG